MPSISSSMTMGWSAMPPRLGDARREKEAEAPSPSGERELSAQDQRLVAELEQTDRQVRQHEMAHMAAGSGLITSGASFTYRQGPDGRRFAVAGEVGISMSRGNTPQDTLARARQIQSAALAPTDPSAQDYSVAAAAAQMALQAQTELARLQQDTSKHGKASPMQTQAALSAYGDTAASSEEPELHLNLHA